MENTFSSEAMAFIETELDSIVKNFEKSLRECNKAAKILVMGSEREHTHCKNSGQTFTRSRLQNGLSVRGQ
jgi:hypothetical protein